MRITVLKPQGESKAEVEMEPVIEEVVKAEVISTPDPVTEQDATAIINKYIEQESLFEDVSYGEDEENDSVAADEEDEEEEGDFAAAESNT